MNSNKGSFRNCLFKDSPLAENHRIGIGTSFTKKGPNRICEAVGCFAEATVEIEVSAGQRGTLPLSLCKNCVNKFTGDE
jgi:hypothetical protein